MERLTMTADGGESAELAVEDGAVRATELRKLGVMSYDPAFLNTASCRSAITYLDGDAGILRYRGYPIEQLAEASSYLETAWLLLFGELPTRDELGAWCEELTGLMPVDETIRRVATGFPEGSHPMAMLVSLLAALATCYPEANQVADPEVRLTQVKRAIAQVATIGALAYRVMRGLPPVEPTPERGFVANFLAMLFGDERGEYRVDPTLERALEVLFILHADHEQNCSTNAMRAIGSSLVDPYSALAGAAAALYGPLHGGANEAVVRMLSEIGDVAHVPDFIEKVKAGHGVRLMGFGHRVYKNYDPRARIIKQTADQVFEVTGRDPLLDIAVELERIALEDEYFVSRKLYPNVDFYTGLIYRSMGFPTEFFTVLFAVARTAGWLAQWEEMLLDKEQKIARPRQVYLGHECRDFVPLEDRA